VRQGCDRLLRDPPLGHAFVVVASCVDDGALAKAIALSPGRLRVDDLLCLLDFGENFFAGGFCKVLAIRLRSTLLFHGCDQFSGLGKCFLVC